MANDVLNMQAGNLLRLLEKLPSMSQMGTIFGLAAALALGMGMVMWALRPSFMPLFPSLSEKDAVHIADELRAQNIPFEIDQTTGLILVPGDKLRELRMKFAADGFPQNSSIGMELLQKDQRFGTSQFIETARYQHALETELGRTIAIMRNVESARVYLALPKQSVFVRGRAKPKASVMVKMQTGRALEDEQVAAIVHLVSSSIPYMEASQVTVVDQWGRLLTSKNLANGLERARQNFEYSQKIEENYERRIEDLLIPIAGKGAVKAKVTIETDFSVNEKTTESFEPDPNQIRSEQLQNVETQENQPIGVPGALTNQPPGAGTTQQPAKTPDGKETKPLNTQKNTTRNYELDKTVTHTRQAQGNIKRLTVAVLVDDRMTVNDKGEKVRQTWNAQEIEAVTALVKQAVGFNAERGDTVVVTNRAFQAQEDLGFDQNISFWEQPWFLTVSKQVIAGLVVLFILLGIVRPAIRSLMPKTVEAPTIVALEAKPAETETALIGKEESAVEPGQEEQEEQEEHASEEEAMSERQLERDQLTLTHRPPEPLLPPPVYQETLKRARALAAEDPKLVALLIKNWVATDG